MFRGTRVPVSARFANLEGGATVEEFVEWFPGFTREQVNAVLEHPARSLAVSEAAYALLDTMWRQHTSGAERFAQLPNGQLQFFDCPAWNPAG